MYSNIIQNGIPVSKVVQNGEVLWQKQEQWETIVDGLTSGDMIHGFFNTTGNFSSNNSLMYYRTYLFEYEKEATYKLTTPFETTKRIGYTDFDKDYFSQNRADAPIKNVVEERNISWIFTANNSKKNLIMQLGIDADLNSTKIAEFLAKVKIEKIK